MHCPGLHGLQQQPCVLIVFMNHKVVLLMYLTVTCNMFCKECLSSIDDEECSKMHYALWIARFREPIDVWMLFAPSGYAWRFAWFNANNIPSVVVLLSIAVSFKGSMCVALDLCACRCVATWTWLIGLDPFFIIRWLLLHIICLLQQCWTLMMHLAWSQAHKPAEFKHISKWWKLNQMGFLK